MTEVLLAAAAAVQGVIQALVVPVKHRVAMVLLGRLVAARLAVAQVVMMFALWGVLVKVVVEAEVVLEF